MQTEHPAEQPDAAPRVEIVGALGDPRIQNRIAPHGPTVPYGRVHLGQPYGRPESIIGYQFDPSAAAPVSGSDANQPAEYDYLWQPVRVNNSYPQASHDSNTLVQTTELQSAAETALSPEVYRRLQERKRSWEEYKAAYSPNMSDSEITQRAAKDLQREGLLPRKWGRRQNRENNSARSPEGEARTSRTERVISAVGAVIMPYVGGLQGMGILRRDFADGFNGHPAVMEYDQTAESRVYRLGVWIVAAAATVRREATSGARLRHRSPATLADVTRMAYENKLLDQDDDAKS